VGYLLADRRVISRAVPDGAIEDGRIRSKPRYRILIDVTLQRSAVQQVARDVVEPDALTQIVELLRRVARIRSLRKS
jgi:hypothetical protein